MSEESSAPRQASAGNSEEHTTGTFKLLGLELPLPGSARTPMAIVAVIAAPVFICTSLYHMQSDSSANQALREAKEKLQQTRTELTTLQDNLRSTRDDYDEYVKHTGDTGREFHRDLNLTVTYYESDGCIYVLRPPNGVWVRDPSRKAPPSRSPGDVERGQSSELRSLGSPLVTLAAYRPDGDQGPGAIETRDLRKGGTCLNPHPGKYQSSDGQRRGCWLQIWRRWPDGCAHYQWFNTCSSYWDKDSKGQPIVYWTSCTH